MKRKYVSIPIEIWNLSELHPNERVLLAEVASFDENGRECWAGNDHFADLLNVAQSTARDYIDRLIELGYVDREGTRYDRRLSQSTKTKSLFNYNEVVKRRKRNSQSTKTKSSNPAHTNTYTNTLTKSYTKSAHPAVVLPFESDDFVSAWNEWKEYKRTDHRFKYKSAQSEQRALMKLTNEYTTEAECIDAIHRAIANGWKGLVFKQPKNGRTDRPRARDLEDGINKQKLEEFARTGRITTDRRDVF